MTVPLETFDHQFSYGKHFNLQLQTLRAQVIINSEVWDLRTHKLLRSVASLDNTTITFSPTGDVIYAILRRSSDELNAALNPKRQRHPLWAAFRTLDAADYSDIATVPVDRCVLDLAVDPTDSYVGAVAIDGQGIESNVKVGVLDEHFEREDKIGQRTMRNLTGRSRRLI